MAAARLLEAPYARGKKESILGVRLAFSINGSLGCAYLIRQTALIIVETIGSIDETESSKAPDHLWIVGGF